jgi:hypothetical protein
MPSAFFRSVAAFSFLLQPLLFADGKISDEELFEEVVVEENAAGSEQQKPSAKPRVIFAVKNQEQKGSENPKKLKPQYAGARRPPEKPKTPEKEKKSPHIKNQWFTSKTHPKIEKKEEVNEEEEAPTELPADHPYFMKTSYLPTSATNQLFAYSNPSKEESKREEITEGNEFPRGGFQAPCSHFYLTAEWLYWRIRQEGMEFATSQIVDFDFQSGFRVGLGVHFPHDHWDIYVNYTRFLPDASESRHGSFYPLFLFQGTGAPQGATVSKAHALWKIEFQTVDIEIGRAYYIAKTLAFHPFFGLKGAWIDQDAKFHYEGGFIPHGQAFRTKFRDDFKGAGPLIGIESNWVVGAGFNFFGDIATALVIGQFFDKQEQRQLDRVKVVDLNTDFHLVSPTVQIAGGIAWDRNFHRDRLHFGLSAGFETQYWWGQNQREQFTDDHLPIYVREKGDLAFYGLTLRGRLDF